MMKVTSFLLKAFSNISAPHSLYEKKNTVYYFQISLFVPEMFKFLQYANYMICSTKFCSNMMKKDISANLYQKCLILCSNILLYVLHNTSLTVLTAIATYRVPELPMLKTFLAIFDIPF